MSGFIGFLIPDFHGTTCTNSRCKRCLEARGKMDTIGTLSRKTGCHIETIRYYERIGLLSKPARTEGGHRLYDKEQIKRLVFIRRSRELGFSLEEIRTLFRLVESQRYTCQEVKRVTEQHIKDVTKKISDLRRLHKTLRSISFPCKGGWVQDCPIIEALFEEQQRKTH